MDKNEIDERPKPFRFGPVECMKYDVFVRWAKSCGHYQVLKSAESFDQFIESVREVSDGTA